MWSIFWKFDFKVYTLSGGICHDFISCWGGGEEKKTSEFKKNLEVS